MSSPWPTSPPSAAHRAAYADAEVRPFWQTTVDSRAPHPPLEHSRDAELCIVGAGFTGLWAALYSKELDPARDVVVLEATRCGDGASSRNGGFLQASLTHGIENGLTRFPDELRRLERLGHENFEQLQRDLDIYGIAAEFENTGGLDVALEPHELPGLHEWVELAGEHGHEIEFLDQERTRAEVNSPLYVGGVWDHTGSAIVNPAKLVDGLRRAALAKGVAIHEYSPVTGFERATGSAGTAAGTGSGGTGSGGTGSGGTGSAGTGTAASATAGVRVITRAATVNARKVLLATSAYPPLLRSTGMYIAPVYDYALMTEPLSESQLADIGWQHRQGIGDLANQFHYYRLSADNRILWGGYDAVYRYGGPVGPQYDDHDPTFSVLAQHFFTTFPQLEGIRFSHRWGGAIDTCSRFSVFFGTAFSGDLAYALGYTGLGVGASRFGGRTALDLVDGRQTDATGLRLVRERPLPFPPEPLRSAVIQLTRNRLAAADRNQGRRGLWLRTLDRAGLGFDS